MVTIEETRKSIIEGIDALEAEKKPIMDHGMARLAAGDREPFTTKDAEELGRIEGKIMSLELALEGVNMSLNHIQARTEAEEIAARRDAFPLH